MTTTASNDSKPAGPSKKSRVLLWVALLAVVAFATFGITALLVTIFEHRQESRTPFVRLVEVNELSTDPVPWGMNWPYEFDTYRRTVDDSETEFGGSSAMPASKLEEHPWLRRLYAGYAFSIDYREARGHAYMLLDQEVTERVTKRPQTGACLHCHASIIPTYRRLGVEGAGEKADTGSLAADFNWPAVMKGFEIASKMDYQAAHAELSKTPDGTSPRNSSDAQHLGDPHPVSCIDCHDPQTMHVRVTRPGFIKGIAALAASEDSVPHLPSIERWRASERKEPYDPNVDASRQEMRSFVCGQCHVEYYCGDKEPLFFPWNNGLKVEQIEQTYKGHKFPDDAAFYDFEHGETGAKVYKAQHPEFELWSQGVHARSGVSCADCHMPYERQGAMKVSSHWVRSPLLNINRACQTCHNVPEEELRNKVDTIQARTDALRERAAVAMTDMLDAILEAKAAGATSEQLAPVFELQKMAMWRLDFISSENSDGFHADQEAARILGESIDFSRQAQAAALRLRAPTAPPINQSEAKPVEGVTPAKKPTDGAPEDGREVSDQGAP
jgi:nitrite reductase (cytochrome c-552)